MSNNTTYLIDQLDKRLEGEELLAFEASLRKDKAMEEEWQNLQIALSTIREAGLKEQVEAIAREYRQANSKPASRPQGRVVPMYRQALRIAAIVVLLVGASVIYKYSTVNALNFYESHYTSYDLGTTRGEANADQLEKAYREKQWHEVIALFNGLKAKNNKAYFLAGQSNLELKNPAAAIPMFTQILENNANGTDAHFHDEAEYYLALGYLATHNSEKALPLLKKIGADKDHLYQRVVNEMSGVDLKIIQYKGNK